MLFEIDSSDPLTLTAVGVTVAVVTVIAALAPAWRAASTDPLAVLRSE
jgi:ABC-type lipoprotein release transport system permease subunit